MHLSLQVTEEMLATSFAECGTVVDCRICGDPNSAMRFAFIEFSTAAEAQRVRGRNSVLGYVCDRSCAVCASVKCAMRFAFIQICLTSCLTAAHTGASEEWHGARQLSSACASLKNSHRACQQGPHAQVQ